MLGVDLPLRTRDGAVERLTDAGRAGQLGLPRVADELYRSARRLRVFVAAAPEPAAERAARAADLAGEPRSSVGWQAKSHWSEEDRSMISRRTFVRSGTGLGARPRRRQSPLGRMPPTIPRRLTVYKSPTCGCCAKWVDHVKAAGFTTVVHDDDDMSTREGQPRRAHASCAPATPRRSDKYVIEGHVPAEDIHRLLKRAAQGGGSGRARHAGQLTRHGGARRAARALRGAGVSADGDDRDLRQALELSRRSARGRVVRLTVSPAHPTAVCSAMEIGR